VSRAAYADEFARAERVIAGHVIKERQSRSFDFRNPRLGSFYAYSVTWTPGTIVLAGDLGEMTITHWHALHKFKSGMEWLATAHWDYLLSKVDGSSRDDIPDVGATVGTIVEIVTADPRSRLAERILAEFELSKAWGAGLRRGLVKRLTERLEDMDVRQTAEFCYELHVDDFFGHTRRNPHTLFQITAIQRAADMIIGECFPYEWL
jgi:hypothetical protein